MGSEFSPEKIQMMKNAARKGMQETLDELGRDYPKAVEAAGAAVGSALGGAASFTALYFGGSVVGLSAAGITSGLAAAGAIVGGGMAAGVGVLAAPVAAVGIVSYAIIKKRKNAKLTTALNRAIQQLYTILEMLMANAEYFREELAEIKAYIDQLETQRP